jgi:hypothetical protein
MNMRIVIVLCFLFFGNQIAAQKHIAFICYDTTGNYELPFNDSLIWSVNGELIIPDTLHHPVTIHWPGFDTVRMKNGYQKERVIITRFSPDSSYYLIPYGCCNDIDISERTSLSAERQQLLDSLIESEDYYMYKYVRDSIYMQVVEKGTVLYKVVSASSKDTLGGTLGHEHGEVTGGVLLKNNSTTTSGKPFKLTLNSGDYCMGIRVGKVKNYPADSTKIEGEYVFFESNGDNKYYFITEEYFAIEYRFLRPETLLITIDARTKKCSMKVLH